MLKIIPSMKELDFSQLMDVYLEGNQENGQFLFPDMPEGLQMLHAQQDFYAYLTQVFYKTKRAAYYVWIQEDLYVAAVRTEPYRDGILISALETKPSHRGRGYATKLLHSVCNEHCGRYIYSHVSKQNAASLRVHKKCGFAIVSDMAVYIDGSVSRNAYTLKIDV